MSLNCLEAIAKFPEIHIAVVGDLILDEYLWGDVTRISPEAPVPVINVIKKTFCPGGAANVMRNIATLGAHAEAFGVIGNDAGGDELRHALKDLNIGDRNIVISSHRCTTRKCRIVASSQQLLRADFEETSSIEESLRNQLVKNMLTLIEQRKIQGIIFDDYAKGVLSTEMLEKIIPAAKAQGIFTMLDPKPRCGGVEQVKGLTLLKPNRHEAFTMAGIADSPLQNPAEDKKLHQAAAKIFELWQPEYLLISLASCGMALFRQDMSPIYIPTRAREVFDVCGAGDTVAAVCALAWASGCTPETAAQLANYAAGVVVGKIGTAPIYTKELITALNHAERNN